MIISPSILAADFLNLEREIMLLNKNKDIWLHLDIMDGHFVPNLTFGHEIIKKICHLSQNPCDAHLMVTNPEFYIDTLKGSNLHNLTFHIEATKEPGELVKKAKGIFPSVGISIKPGTPKELLSIDLLKQIDLILVMSVEPGFGGQTFINDSLDKISYFYNLKINHNLNFDIQVDGGINDRTSKECIEKGATNLVAGSYIFKSDNYEKIISSLRERSKSE
ncbi:MAG: ribulose-phosphate 3-epimerase [Halobacteriovoraceae bacterium]|nr:ribulose-phosphate 3-epimerase [Halobacteriovoraceae bacterium]|tara:strand:+ start:320 stop:979 length:660 start_codon:yes stop_codon:yes gene_type:complete